MNAIIYLLAFVFLLPFIIASKATDSPLDKAREQLELYTEIADVVLAKMNDNQKQEMIRKLDKSLKKIRDYLPKAKVTVARTKEVTERRDKYEEYKKLAIIEPKKYNDIRRKSWKLYESLKIEMEMAEKDLREADSVIKKIEEAKSTLRSKMAS